MKESKFYPTFFKLGSNAFAFLTILIITLNFLSGIVGGVWLVISGAWILVLVGLVMSIFMPWGWSFAFLFQLAFMPFLTKAIEKRDQFWVAILGFITSLYGNILIIAWTYFVFEYFLDFRDEYNLLALLLLGYSVAISPLQGMAQKEGPNNSGSIMGVFLSQLSYIVLSVITLVGGDPYIEIPILIAVIFSTIMSVLVTISVSSTSQGDDYENCKHECSNCGSIASEDSNFCINCGYKLENI